MTHETVVHRADAAFVAARTPGGSTGADRPFAVVEDVAVDALDEWMSFGSLPVVRETTPRIADFTGRGHTLRFQAADAAPEAAADWLIALEADALTWRRPPSPALSPPLARGDTPTALAAPATTTVRGALSDLPLLVYGRIPARGAAPAPVGAGTGPVEIRASHCSTPGCTPSASGSGSEATRGGGGRRSAGPPGCPRGAGRAPPGTRGAGGARPTASTDPPLRAGRAGVSSASARQ
ncbi:hypothetical protein [Streptomyces noursei]|uniref:hypothetical protein n=1 Tax=Streptomyces noursei TaxID=1971 RepID=UPI001677AD8A|nr:hypothetical protein [Streptomyces noursei]MCZ1017351.1 hypothetical protein [Streptomyces noursei]